MTNGSGRVGAERTLVLFRQAAVDHQVLKRWGETVPLQPPSLRVMVGAVAVSALLIGVFLGLAQYARKETVTGYLAPSAGIVKVLAPRPGTVRAVHVEEGWQVTEGQPLLSVSVDQTAADGGNVDAAILDALTRQKAMLVEQIDAQEDRTRADRSRLEAVLANVGSEILLLETQAGIQRERIAVASSLLSSLRQLRDKGHAPDAEFKRRHQELLDHRRELASLEQQAIALRTQAVELRHEMDRLPASAAERLLDLRTRLSDTERLVAEAEGRRAYVVRSPVSGRVSALQSVVGRAVDPAQVQMSILPDGSTLQAQLFVPSRAIGFVRQGQEVRLLYDAFPYQRFGAHQGRIVRVSRTALTQADTSGPISLTEASYRVTVALAAQEIDALGMKHPLQADMRVVADIILDRRSLVAWLLNPLLSTRN